MPTTPQEFVPIAKALLTLGYRKRRKFLWERVKPKLPRFLYKFRSLLPSDETSVDRLRDILVRSRLWFSSPADFNDPFDTAVKAIVDGDAIQLRKRVDVILQERNVPWSKRQREIARILSRPRLLSIIQEGVTKSINEMGVCSFGGDPRSILMWSHYAANHEGLCLQFEVARDVENLISLEVKYREEYPELRWVGGMDELASILLTKYSGWSYEQERRIIVPEGARQFFEFRPVALTAIITGCRAGDNVVGKLNGLLAERVALGYPMPKLYRVFLDDSNYQLIVKRTDRPLP